VGRFEIKTVNGSVSDQEELIAAQSPLARPCSPHRSLVSKHVVSNRAAVRAPAADGVGSRDGHGVVRVKSQASLTVEVT